MEPFPTEPEPMTRVRQYQANVQRTLIADAEVPSYPATQLHVALEFVTLAERTANAVESLKKRVFHLHAGLAGLRWRQEDEAHTAHVLSVKWEKAADRIADDLVTLHQAEVLVTLEERPRAVRFLWNLVGLIGETGELAKHVLNYVAGGQPLHKEGMKKELGDIIWYAAALAECCDLDLVEILTFNIHRLRLRYPDKWDFERSQHAPDADT